MDGVLPLLGVIIGGGLTWGIGEWARRHARKDEWTKIRRTKLEEVFSEMASLERKAAQFAVAELRRLNGDEVEPVEVNLRRLPSLLSIYFPETMHVLEAHDRRQEEMQADRVNQLKVATKKDPAAIRSFGAQIAVGVNVEIGQFLGELRPVLAEVARNLAEF